MKKASCYKFPFALSRQDVEEGIIRWEFGRLYLIAHGADSYCVHLDRVSYRCTVWEQRPVPCLGFNCEDNEKRKVWADYGEKIVNDGLVERIDKDNRTVYKGSKLK